MIANKDKNAKTLKPLAKWGSGTLPSFLYIDCITALPIHDAVLVSEIHVYKSKQVMEQVFMNMTDVPSVVMVE